MRYILHWIADRDDLVSAPRAEYDQNTQKT